MSGSFILVGGWGVISGCVIISHMVLWYSWFYCTHGS
ncbi:hypothetical protein M6B38_392440 [Iris pallida]|uniref:Uncharacterized protein n=1 Tax=Iris pallida TaxID=29817 RepID=A0AAX6FYH1_IRIPA|nr:hypothetical protein M6B38_392440 [Iris pallida]